MSWSLRTIKLKLILNWIQRHQFQFGVKVLTPDANNRLVEMYIHDLGRIKQLSNY